MKYDPLAVGDTADPAMSDIKFLTDVCYAGNIRSRHFALGEPGPARTNLNLEDEALLNQRPQEHDYKPDYQESDCPVSHLIRCVHRRVSLTGRVLRSHQSAGERPELPGTMEYRLPSPTRMD